MVVVFFLSKGQSIKPQTSSGIDEPPQKREDQGQQQKRAYSEIKKYNREKLFYHLKGVAFDNKSEAFDEVETGDLVFVQFDNKNEFDKNALGVYTAKGKLLGYVERGQRRLIKTLRDEPNNLSYVAEKIFLPANAEFRNPYKRIVIEIWVVFPNTELQVEKQRRLDRVKFGELRSSFDLKLSVAKETLDTVPMDSMKIMEEVCVEMAMFNRTTVDEKKFKLPLNDLTILTNRHGLFDKTVALCETYLQVSNLSDRQKDEILKRVQKTKEKTG